MAALGIVTWVWLHGYMAGRAEHGWSVWGKHCLHCVVNSHPAGMTGYGCLEWVWLLGKALATLGMAPWV